MKAKQKKIRIFDIVVDSEDKFFPYMEKNSILLKDYLLVISGEVTDNIKKYLDENSFCYVLQNDCNLKIIDKSNDKVNEQKNSSNIQSQQTKVEFIQQIVHDEKIVPTKIINKPVRSGEVIESDGDIIVFSRINSGAKIVSEGNVFTFDVIDGVVESYGDICFIKKINKGHVIFNGDILDKDDFDGNLKKVIKTSEGYKIEDISCSS